MRFLIALILIFWSTTLQASLTLHSNENDDVNRIVEMDTANHLSKPELSTEEKASSPAPFFWVSTQVRSIQWKRNCLTTMLCSEPRFTLANAMPKFNEKVTSDWSISKTIASEISSSSPSYLQLYTYWTKGVPEDVSVQLYVLGTDPAFRFNRLCDETPNVHIFPHNSYKTNTQQIQKLEDQLETVLELRGNCFNATLLVRKHTVRCPWCPVEVSSGLAQNSAQHTAEFNSSDPEPGRTKILIGFLAAITLINTIAFVGLLLMCLLKCRKGKVDSGKEMSITSSNSHISAPSSRDSRNYPISQPPFQKYPYSLPPVSQCTLISTMPAIHEEHYEIIRDESFSPLPSLHPYLRPKTTKRNTNRVAVQLPTSRRCDHCFLGAAASGGEGCSCSASPNLSSLDSSRESDSGLESHFDSQN